MNRSRQFEGQKTGYDAKMEQEAVHVAGSCLLDICGKKIFKGVEFSRAICLRNIT